MRRAGLIFFGAVLGWATALQAANTELTVQIRSEDNEPVQVGSLFYSDGADNRQVALGRPDGTVRLALPPGRYELYAAASRSLPSGYIDHFATPTGRVDIVEGQPLSIILILRQQPDVLSRLRPADIRRMGLSPVLLADLQE